MRSVGTERERLTRVAMSMLNIRREANKGRFILFLFLVFYIPMERKKLGERDNTKQ